jgi:SET domain-containing protein
MKSRKRVRDAIDGRFTRFQLRVGRSPIEGTGVFALERIPRGKRVIEYTGEKLTEQQARQRLAKLSRPAGGGCNCIFRVSDGHCIDGAVDGSGAELINHSCDPNLKSRKGRGRVFYYSRRSLRAGEELTVDYNFRRDAKKVPCQCGSQKCRGTINRK